MATIIWNDELSKESDLLKYAGTKYLWKIMLTSSRCCGNKYIIAKGNVIDGNEAKL